MSGEPNLYLECAKMLGAGKPRRNQKRQSELSATHCSTPRTDTQRLDWLASNGNADRLYAMVDGFTITDNYGSGAVHPTIREAIDAEMVSNAGAHTCRAKGRRPRSGTEGAIRHCVQRFC
jgi:hypothetical protein